MVYIDKIIIINEKWTVCNKMESILFVFLLLVLLEFFFGQKSTHYRNCRNKRNFFFCHREYILRILQMDENIILIA